MRGRYQLTADQRAAVERAIQTASRPGWCSYETGCVIQRLAEQHGDTVAPLVGSVGDIAGRGMLPECLVLGYPIDLLMDLQDAWDQGPDGEWAGEEEDDEEPCRDAVLAYFRNELCAPATVTAGGEG
jgi:hypothetical protein